MTQDVDALRDLERFELAIEGSRLGARARAKRDLSDALRANAFRLFLDEGYDAVTVAAIADAAGVTSRTFFRYFPSKETVVVDLMDQTNDRLIEILRVQSRGEPSIVEAIRRALHSWFAEHRPLYDLMGSLVRGSAVLSAALLLRSVEWERHLADAIHEEYPRLSRVDARMWGVITYAFTRLIGDAAEEAGTPNSEAIDPVIDGFISQTNTR